MMNRKEILNIIEDSGIVAVIRLNDTSKIEYIIDALGGGGVKALEITMTTPNAMGIIKQLSSKINDDFLIGVGTVLDGITAENAIQAGAQFVVSPILDEQIISTSHCFDKPVFPGAYTPTEIFHAWKMGADIVKVFPATSLGPQFFKDIHGPLPEIKLTPTGGVSLENAAEFIRKVAACIGVGTALLNKDLIKNSKWPELTQLAKYFVAEVKKGRNQN